MNGGTLSQTETARGVKRWLRRCESTIINPIESAYLPFFIFLSLGPPTPLHLFRGARLELDMVTNTHPRRQAPTDLPRSVHGASGALEGAIRSRGSFE